MEEGAGEKKVISSDITLEELIPHAEPLQDHITQEYAAKFIDYHADLSRSTDFNDKRDWKTQIKGNSGDMSVIANNSQILATKLASLPGRYVLSLGIRQADKEGFVKTLLSISEKARATTRPIPKEIVETDVESAVWFGLFILQTISKIQIDKNVGRGHVSENKSQSYNFVRYFVEYVGVEIKHGNDFILRAYNTQAHEFVCRQGG